jgi:lysophospholipase L1-like esterase
MADLARRDDVPLHVYWQAQQQPWPEDLLAGLPARVTDLSGVFDEVEEPIYIDGVHTNELGARLVAEALWADLGDDLRAQLG